MKWENDEDYYMHIKTEHEVVPAPFNAHIEMEMPNMIFTDQRFTIKASLLFDEVGDKHIYGLKIHLPEGFSQEKITTEGNKQYVFDLRSPSTPGSYVIDFEIASPIETFPDNFGYASFEAMVFIRKNYTQEEIYYAKKTLDVTYGKIIRKAMINPEAKRHNRSSGCLSWMFVFNLFGTH